MAFKIPKQAITCEAAVTGSVSLVRFLINASKDVTAALKDTDWDRNYPTVADVKEAFYVHLHQELLTQELALLKQTPDPAPEGDTSSQCFSQYIEFVLDAASRVILSFYKSGGETTALRQVSLKPKGIEKIVRRFYAEFLSSIFGFYLEQRMMLKTDDRDDGKANRNLLHSKDFKNIHIRRSYINNRIRCCREIIYKTMQVFPLSKTFCQSGDNEQMKAEIRDITGKLAQTRFAVDISAKIKTIPFYLVCGQSAAPEVVEKYSKWAKKVLRLNEDKSIGNITLRQIKMEQLLGKELSAKSKDLLRLAGFFYVADTQVPRHQQWRRRIHFIVPVESVELWKDMAQQLSYTLSFLSGDCISVEFYRQQPMDCANVEHPKSLTPNETVTDCTCLLSGGIDSFAGVLKLVKDKHRPIVISHFSQSSVAHVQKELMDFIRNKHGNDAALHLQLKIGKNKRPREEKKENQLYHNCENTQRTRSFLYFSLAAVAAVESGVDKLFITENGVSSFNLPITRAYASTRCGRPTHPRNIYNFNRIINRLYGRDVSMLNRYVFNTKGEFIAAAIETRDEKEVLEKTTTCPRYRFRLKNDDRLDKESQVNIDNINNCGLCYECLLRLASLHAAGIRPDMNKYIMHPLKDTLKLKDSEITTLIRFITNCTDWEDLSDRELLRRYPDLCLPARYFPGHCGSTGEHTNYCAQAIAVHKRYAGEFLDWLIDEAGEDLKEMTGLFREKPTAAVDVHCHVDRFADPFYLMAKAAVENVKVVAVGMDLRSTRINFHFARYFDSIIPGAGLHPEEAPAYLEKYGNLRSLFAYIDRTPFVGEIGLDYYFVKSKESHKKQQEAFGQILDYCKGKDKVLNIHSKGAEEDVINELRRYKIKKAILHWYSGPEKLLRAIEANGYYVSVNRSIKKSKKLQAMVKKLPRELVLVESDGPMTKGSRPTHTPFDFPEVLGQLSELWGMDKEKSRQQVLENFRSLTSSSDV
jgi:TatD DNase family protein